jgi:hypothetical protein
MTHRISDNGTDRDMTLEEIQLYEEYMAESQANKAAIAAREAARAAVLAKLGLTADEAAALFG